MKVKILNWCLLLVLLVGCKSEQKPQQVYNPFSTPEGCVKEYLDAQESDDIGRMLKCYSYDPKYERILREGLQKILNENHSRLKNYPDYYYKTDSVVVKDIYPNSAVVTVHYINGYRKDDISPASYDLNLVKDSTNWKLEAVFGWGFAN